MAASRLNLAPFSSRDRVARGAWLSFFILVSAACSGDSGDRGRGSHAGDDAGVFDGGGAGGTRAIPTGPAGGTGSVDDMDAGADTPCEGGCDGGVCVDGVCCAESDACGDECCAAGRVCSFQVCVEPGATCTDSADCAKSEYCELSLGDEQPDPAPGCKGGSPVPQGRCLERPPACEAGEEPGTDEPFTCLPECNVMPKPGAFEPKLIAAWSGQSVMMTPIVIQLDDDNCNGEIDARDIPEIVFLGFPNVAPPNTTMCTTTADCPPGSTVCSCVGGAPCAMASGKCGWSAYTAPIATLWAISLLDGAFVEKWSFTATPEVPLAEYELAGGNIDGKPGNEIVACTPTGPVAFTGTGSVLWKNFAASCRQPSIADVDRDGKPEVITEKRILNGEDGTVQATLDGNYNVAVDITGDADLEIVTASKLFDHTGALLADTGVPGTSPAVGDFDEDGVPEIVNIHATTHLLSVWHYDDSKPGDFEMLRTGIDINGTFANTCPMGSSGELRGGGPPTIADFNGDGTADVAVAGGIGYAVIDGKKILDSSVPPDEANLWLTQTQDCSSAVTGSSVFDFNGDRRAEVVYSDEVYLRIYDGKTGDVLMQECNTTGTLIEYPPVADVDADGSADIVVASNDYSSITCPDDGSTQRGIRVYGDLDGHWVRTRRIWNQHAYHVTNVEEDGTIPKEQEKNWLVPRLNNFRQNVQPAGEFSAPDLIVSLTVRCGAGEQLFATVRNVGSAEVPAGVVVSFYRGTGGARKRIGKGTTAQALAPAESTVVTFKLDEVPAMGTLFSAVVADGGPAHAWRECRAKNNESALVPFTCSGPE